MNCRMHLFLRTAALILLSSKIFAIQYNPLEIDYSDCALVLPNTIPYTTDLLRSDLAGSTNCITYNDINRVYADARRRIDIPVVEDDWKPEEVAAVGQLLLDVAQQLTKEFNLNIEDIELGLPQIDTLKTAIADICPVFLSSISCRAGKYRRQDGLCNNAGHPSWGASNTPFTRLLPPQFTDHISAPRVSVTGNGLPSARMVSRTVHTDEGYHDHAGTMMTVAWGQFMDHDFTLMGTPVDLRNRNEPEECCNRPDLIKNPYCMEIEIPEDDYFYGKFNIKCQDFVRAFPAAQPNCRLGSRTPFNTLTGVIDANTVYGVTDTLARQLRTGHGGLLKMNPAFASLGLKELLPMKVDVPDEGCIRTNSSQFCFQAGEVRVNEQLVLTCIHTLMAREHNRIALELAQINPHWDDEILYQEARRIVIAEVQHITFSEFLPLILGKAIMQKYDLDLTNEGYWDGYNSEINPSILDAFSAAAFRFGHSLLPSAVERWSKVHKFIASKRLSDMIRRPYDLYRAGVLDEYFMGLLNQVAQAMDDSVTQEVTNNLFKKTGNRFGLDLVSFNIQRGRDFGLPGYMYFRKHCGLSTADNFFEMFDMMPNSTIYRYMSIYEHPWDIDLWSGGVAEHPLPGSMVGPTFACIIAMQMNLLKRGDRFWYELPNQPSSFTPEQLQEIRKIKLSRVLCDNTDLLDTVQIYAMVLPDHDINPRVPCKSLVLPKLDLSHWADKPIQTFEDPSFRTTNIVNEVPTVTNNSLPLPLYAYHVKTVAVIEGSNPTLNVNALLTTNTNITDDQPSAPTYREDSDYEYHRLSKRDTNFQPVHSSSNIHTNRHAPLRSRMTQAIMRGPSNTIRSRSSHEDADIENFFRRNVPIYDGISPSRNRGYNVRPYPNRHINRQTEDEEESDREQPVSVEEIDPEHDAQYEEVPMMVNEHGKQKVMTESDRYEHDFLTKYSFPTSRPTYHSQYKSRPSPHHSSQFHGRPSLSNEDSGRFLSESRFPNEHNYHFHNSQHARPQYSTFHHQPPANHPYRFEHAAFRTHDSDAFTNPPKYGTSHQYNSLADEKPRFYKHFAPSIRTQQSSSSDDEFSYPVDTSDYNEEPSRAPYKEHDFPSAPPAPVRRPIHPNSAYRTAQVPQTLEEYHRLHNNLGSKRLRQPPRAENPFYNRAKSPKTPKAPRKIPPKQPKDEDEEEKDDKEDEDDKEDKDDDFSSKSFVSMNFKNFNLNDNGVSIKHQIPLSRARPNDRFLSHKPLVGNNRDYKSFLGESEHRSSFGDDDEAEADNDRTFPNVPPKEGSPNNPEFEDPEVVKAFVTSMFGGGKDKASSASNSFKDFPNRSSSMKKNSSPFNPHFGERVKMITKPAQNLLWHRKANEASKERSSNFKNFGREKSLLDQDDAKIFDSLPKDFSYKQSSKRDVDFHDHASEPPIFSTPANVTTEYADDEDEESEMHTTSMPVSEDHEEHHSHEEYTSEFPNDEVKGEMPSS